MWQDNEYVYSKGMLKRIAYSYQHIYQGIGGLNNDIVDWRSIAEYKADFDRALNGIGRGHWTGNIDELTFRDFKSFGRLQRIVIADIYGIADGELEQDGLYRIQNLRSIAYGRMLQILNDGA